MSQLDLDSSARAAAGDRLGECAAEIAVTAVMSRALVTVTPDESVVTAYELVMAAGVHHLPVVDEEGRPIGLLGAQTLAETWPTTAREGRQRAVASLLGSRRPDCVLVEASLRVAAVDMYLGGTDAVCVVGGDGRLVGIVTARDIVAAVAGRPSTAG